MGEITDTPEEILRRAVRRLRAWQWMSAISTRPEDAVAVLTDEARALVQLGIAHPDRARDIGELIVSYHRLIVRLKTRSTASLQTT